MNVVYDHQIFSSQKYGGISRYFVELADGMASHENTRVTILAPFHMNEFLRERHPSSLVGAFAPVLPRTGRLRRLANDALSRAWLATHRPSILHETYYRARSLNARRTPTVVTVFDMIHERFPTMFPSSDRTAQFKAAAIRRADAVICISERTRRDLLELLPVGEDRVTVVHLAHTFRLPVVRSDADDITGPYLLYVGLRRGYKNFPALLEAIAGSELLRCGFRLVCFGGGALSARELELATRLGLDSKRLLYRDGGDDRLARLYANASVFVYPSLYEGFGIPLLEAMGYRCPVACSETSSLPEVAGNAAEYFDPTRPDSIAAAVLRIVNSSTYAEELRRRGAERAKSFSWERCARETHSVYDRLV